MQELLESEAVALMADGKRAVSGLRTTRCGSGILRWAPV